MSTERAEDGTAVRGDVDPDAGTDARQDDAGGLEGDVTAAMVRVVRGEPDDVELAALVAGIVAARAAGADEPRGDEPAMPWTDRARRLGVRTPGPTTWRWSSHP